jgi:hypothetical protein
VSPRSCMFVVDDEPVIAASLAARIHPKNSYGDTRGQSTSAQSNGSRGKTRGLSSGVGITLAYPVSKSFLLPMIQG